VLFGNVLGVSRGDVVWLVVAAAAVAAAVALRYRALLFTSFDAEVAAASGVRVGRVDALLMTLLTVAVLGSMTILGVTLVAAAIVTPAATARLLTPSFTRMLATAVALGAAAGLVGMVASYHLDLAPGPVIVLVDGVLFAAAYGWSAATSGRRRPRVPDPAPPPTALAPTRRGRRPDPARSGGSRGGRSPRPGTA
jgi:ABC-type Mn2+/Zn2+ transport system permease subunit